MSLFCLESRSETFLCMLASHARVVRRAVSIRGAARSHQLKATEGSVVFASLAAPVKAHTVFFTAQSEY